MENQNLLSSIWNTGELPEVTTIIVIDDNSIIKVAVMLLVVVLVTYILFKIL